jgi:hypothetical protein
VLIEQRQVRVAFSNTERDRQPQRDRQPDATVDCTPGDAAGA